MQTNSGDSVKCDRPGTNPGERSRAEFGSCRTLLVPPGVHNKTATMLGVESYQPAYSDAQHFANLTPVPGTFAVPSTAAFSFPKGVEPFYAHHQAQWAAAMYAPTLDTGAPTPGEAQGEPRMSPHFPPEEESQDGLTSPVEPPPPKQPAAGRTYDPAPVSPPPQRERFSYTRYQLEVLNGIYSQIRYPNSMQKQLIAKRVGITRDQTKIWFQNRRRKDIVAATKGGKKEKEDTRQSMQSKKMVANSILHGVIGELFKYANDPKGKKLRESMGGEKSGGRRRGSQKTPSPPLPLDEDEDSLSPTYQPPSVSPKYQPNGSFSVNFAATGPPPPVMNIPGFEALHSQQPGPLAYPTYPTSALSHPQNPEMTSPPLSHPSVVSNPEVTSPPLSHPSVASNPEMTSPPLSESNPEMTSPPLSHPSLAPNQHMTSTSPYADMVSTGVEAAAAAAAAAAVHHQLGQTSLVTPNSSSPAVSPSSVTGDLKSTESPPNVTIGPNMEVVIPSKDSARKRAEMMQALSYSAGSPDTAPSDHSKPSSPTSPLSEVDSEFMPPNTVAPPSEPIGLRHQGTSAPVMVSPPGSHSDESRDSSENITGLSAGVAGYHEGKPPGEYPGNYGDQGAPTTHIGYIQDDTQVQMNLPPMTFDPSKSLNLDRVFPFPMMAEPSAMLSNFQAYHDPYGAMGMKYPPHSMPYRDPYQPLMIQTYGNPYYSDVSGGTETTHAQKGDITRL